jgi:predicted Rossmann-fold nucleotide-binding protein
VNLDEQIEPKVENMPDIDSALEKIDELSAIVKKTEQLVTDLKKKKLQQLQSFTKSSTSLDGSEFYSALDDVESCREAVQVEINEANELINKTAREIQELLEICCVVKYDTGRPTGSNIIERNEDIRKEYDDLLEEGYTHPKVQEILSEKHNFAKTYIRTIYYDQKVKPSNTQ